MSSTKLQALRTFLTERFTTVAVEIFGEVETIVEAYYEENQRLRSALHMVLSPQIKIPRIGWSPSAITHLSEESFKLLNHSSGEFV